MEKEHNINFANGFQITFYTYSGRSYIAITNQNGFIISEQKLSLVDKQSIEDILKVCNGNGRG